MASGKSTPERKSRSGSYVPNDMRGGARVEIRCSEELAERARRVARERGQTLAQLLEAGVDAAEATE
jgi:hypothetical protein